MNVIITGDLFTAPTLTLGLLQAAMADTVMRERAARRRYIVKLGVGGSGIGGKVCISAVAIPPG